MEKSWVNIALGYTAAAIVVGKFISWRSRTKKLPPGPLKLPFVDNLFNMPSGMDWVKFAEMGREYNTEILHMGALGNDLVILNSYRVARDLLDQRSGIYSSRPVSVMMHKLCKLGRYFALSPYGDHWRACRRLFTKYINPNNPSLHQQKEVFYVRRFLYQLLESPENFLHDIRYLVGSASIAMIYGLKARPQNDPNLEMVEDAAVGISEVLSAGTYTVDIVPALQYLPKWFLGAGFLTLADTMAGFGDHLKNGMADVAIKNLASLLMEASNTPPSLLSQALHDLDFPNCSEQDLDILKYSAGQGYAAGADTTVSALSTFFLAMTCYPEVQKRLQDELDAAVDGKLPTHGELESLPYLNAVIREVLRWKPVTPIGIPHRLISDDIYEGQLIPNGAVVIANQWAMLHDPNDYPNPSVFDPERYLKDGKVDETIRNPADIAFGFGRRICPGRHSSQSMLTIAAASVLLMFNITKETDSNGQIIEPSGEYDLGFLCHPKPFPCKITPRSSHAMQAIRSWALEEDQEAMS